MDQFDDLLDEFSDDESMFEVKNQKKKNPSLSDDFSGLGLKSQILEGLKELQFSSMTEVQKEVLPLSLCGRDALVVAPTGTGKTLVYLITLMQRLEGYPAASSAAAAEGSSVRGLILVPTKELAFQVQRMMGTFGVSSLIVMGGLATPEADARKLKKERPLVLVGTPGRLLDLLARQALDLSGVRTLVMDECDELLHKLREDVQSVFMQTPPDKQALLFSATLTPQDREVCHKFMRLGKEFDLYPTETKEGDPAQQALWEEAGALKNVKQMFLGVNDRKKSEKLIELLEKMKYNQVLVFAASRARAEYLFGDLQRAHLPSAFVHGGMDTEERLKVYQRVMDFHVRILVATDLYGRGIDCPTLDLTFNYDMPKDGEQYVHRVGRVGRRLERGMAVSFVSKPEDDAILQYVAKEYRTKIEPLGYGF